MTAEAGAVGYSIYVTSQRVAPAGDVSNKQLPKANDADAWNDDAGDVWLQIDESNYVSLWQTLCFLVNASYSVCVTKLETNFSI